MPPLARRDDFGVAAAHFVSPRFATTHVSHFFAKLGVTIRAETIDRHGLA